MQHLADEYILQFTVCIAIYFLPSERVVLSLNSAKCWWLKACSPTYVHVLCQRGMKKNKKVVKDVMIIDKFDFADTFT